MNMQNIEDFKNFTINQGKILVKDLLKAGGIKTVSFGFFIDVLNKSSHISIDDGPLVKINGECHGRNKWVRIRAYDDIYFFTHEDNPTVRINKETGEFVLIEKDTKSRSMCISCDAAVPLTVAIKFFEDYGIEVTDSLRQKVNRMLKGRQAFGM